MSNRTIWHASCVTYIKASISKKNLINYYTQISECGNAFLAAIQLWIIHTRTHKGLMIMLELLLPTLTRAYFLTEWHPQTQVRDMYYGCCQVTGSVVACIILVITGHTGSLISSCLHYTTELLTPYKKMSNNESIKLSSVQFYFILTVVYIF